MALESFYNLWYFPCARNKSAALVGHLAESEDSGLGNSLAAGCARAGPKEPAGNERVPQSLPSSVRVRVYVTVYLQLFDAELPRVTWLFCGSSCRSIPDGHLGH